ncbi:HlyD family type I secretion periplasmic adaptor subunit [uncultured Campylobacter sp.]|uniref:HlyD family type I secretion periplasmic adaptor subunit n=1 Tax=uncultured Campylobacter sp. TaxID=218934 RepID=UPI00261B0124|nr:HlyD family type I secretion periplasmic adaptor subunit [uncultured Campylobacter sp.]
MILSDERGTIRFGLLTILILVGVFGGWAAFAPLKGGAVAVGKVSVINDKKVVQHLEGGVVDEIYVKDGDKVKEGDILLKIGNSRLQAELNASATEYLQNGVLEARLIAQRDNEKQINFSDELKKLEGFKEASEAQISIFNEQRKMLSDEKEILNQRISQLYKQIDGLNAIISSRKLRAASLDEEIKEWDRLYKEQLSDKIRLRDSKREKIAVDGEIASSTAEIARLNVQITETKSQIILRERTFKEDALKQLESVTKSINALRSRYIALNDQLARTEIRAPASGTIVGMIAHTVGGVVGSGESIMYIVPDSTEYIVEARMNITDIDKVTTGLLADVRFSAFELQQAHVVEGEVIYISADSLQDNNGYQFYKIKVKLTNKGVKELEHNKFFLLPGMPAEVVVQTADRTVLSYILNPFTNMFERAFNED